MKDLVCLSMKVKNNKLYILDQTLLPHEEYWKSIKDPKELAGAICQLKVRGAPLIGVVAAVSLALFAQSTQNENLIKENALILKGTRPTAINLMYCVDQILLHLHNSSTRLDQKINLIVQRAEELFDEDVSLCKQLGKNGIAAIAKGDRILTHCNTGGLATVGEGTALAVIKAAHNENFNIRVYVDETRPLLQGGRLTSWELTKANIPFQLICDNMAGHLMAQNKVDKVIVGSDRIASNGDFANKIGTYSLAVLCQYHKVPFYVAAPYTTVDKKCPDGAAIPIEERSAAEIRGENIVTKGWAPKDCDTFNPAFDVTPASLVTGWILDSGLYSFSEIKQGLLTRLG